MQFFQNKQARTTPSKTIGELVKKLKKSRRFTSLAEMATDYDVQLTTGTNIKAINRLFEDWSKPCRFDIETAPMRDILKDNTILDWVTLETPFYGFGIRMFVVVREPEIEKASSETKIKRWTKFGWSLQNR